MSRQPAALSGHLALRHCALSLVRLLCPSYVCRLFLPVFHCETLLLPILLFGVHSQSLNGYPLPAILVGYIKNSLLLASENKSLPVRPFRAKASRRIAKSALI